MEKIWHSKTSNQMYLLFPSPDRKIKKLDISNLEEMEKMLS